MTASENGTRDECACYTPRISTGCADCMGCGKLHRLPWSLSARPLGCAPPGKTLVPGTQAIYFTAQGMKEIGK